VSGNSPRLPRIPPQIHHKNTTSNHRISAKPPAKTPFHHKSKNGDPANAEPPYQSSIESTYAAE
jgi:hypothetical protein